MSGEEHKGHSTCGLWCVASRINHCCISNCCRSFIGDMQIVRATQDLDADTELLFPYRLSSALEPHGDAQKAFRHWGFTCGCGLCQEKQSTPAKTMRRRGDLSREFSAAVRDRRFPRARTLLEQLRKTYAERSGVPHPELWHQHFELGMALSSHGGDGTEATRVLVRGLETAGFAIVACPPGDTSKEPVLEVTRWGQVDEPAMVAFLQLSLAYRELAPQLCAVAERYAETVYSIYCGEKDTFEAMAGAL